jgi:hypothetical protein
MDESLMNWLMGRIMLLWFYDTWKSLIQFNIKADQEKIKASRELVEKIIEHKASDGIVEYYLEQEREAQIRDEILQRAVDEEKIQRYFMR